MDSDIRILYEQGPCIALVKPSGLPTQAPPGIESLEIRLKSFFKTREGKPEQANIYLGIPHRLDRAASGAMVFARHVRAARRLAQQFEARSIRKLYWALVAGHVEPEQGTWEDYVRKIYGRPQAEIVAETDPESRFAKLHYRTLAHASWGTWLEIELVTGRTHQVRLQAATRGYPVLGDILYGSEREFGEQHADERRRAIALHARQLHFHDPMTREPVGVIAPVDSAWYDLLPSLKDSQ